VALGARSPLRALVVDDNAVNRSVLRRILEAAGHAVAVAENGERALDALEEGGFDVVLMDLNMPVLDGVEATKLYRFASLGLPHLPIIGLTADASPEAAARCLDAGMDGCLTKPVEPARLLEAIGAMLAAPPAAPALPAATGPQVADIASHPNFRRAQPGAGALAGEAAAVATHRAGPAPLGPPLDPAMTERLRALGGEEFMATLARDFLADAERSMAALQAAHRARDLGRFRSAAHALRSSATSIGATELRAFCTAAEAVRLAEFDTAGRAQLGAIIRELERVRGALRPVEPPEQSNLAR
jgi:two-component system sensor histidine kinase RpfC